MPYDEATATDLVTKLRMCVAEAGADPEGVDRPTTRLGSHEQTEETPPA